MGRENVSLGDWGERRAAAHVERLGWEVVARGWRPNGTGQRGDLDLIARDGDVIVVCEVKTRRAGSPGGAVGAVSAAKQEQIRTLTELWLVAQGSPDVRLRFDVIAIDGVRLTHYDDAF